MTTITRIRTYLDDPSLDAKYDNDFIVRQIIEPEMVNVITALNAQRDEPILCKFRLNAISLGEIRTELPPNVGVIARIAKLNSDDTVSDDIARRDETDPRGPGWHLDGRDLHIRPDFPTATFDSYYVWYMPSGDFAPHYSAAGSADNLANGNLVLTLDTTPDVGGLDPRENAYVGGVLRCWNAAMTIVEERVITGHDVSAGTVTVRTAFSSDIDDGSGASTVRYEIVPEFMGHIWQAVALSCSMNLGVARNINEKHMAFLKEQFGLALQSAMRLTSGKLDDKSIAPENSVLYTMLQRIRWGLPEQVEKEMSNDYIMRSVICPKLSEVMTMMNARSDSQTVIRHALTLAINTEYYVLPSCIYKALRLCKTAAGSTIPTEEVRQRDENDPNGNGWSIEGNRLSIRPNPTSGKTSNYLLWYVPSGDFMPHYAKDGTIGNAGKTEIDLTSGGLFSRQLGTVDKRVNAYEGATIRVFETNGTISERTITSHDAVNGIVTVSEAFTSADAATVAYEIVAPWMSTIMSAVVTRSILELMTLKGKLPETDMAILSESAKSAITSAMMAVREKNAQTMVPNKDSCLHMILEKTKTIIGDIAKELDYSDDYIFRHGIVPEYSRVISRIQNSSSEYVIEKTTISLVKDQQYYLLPACIGEIQRIVTMYDDGRIKTELLPRNQYSTRGPNWYVEGEMLAIRPYPQVAEDIEIWYIPTTDAKPHYAEDGGMNPAGSILTLTAGGWASQILGDLDRRESAYQGCVVRVIGRTSGRVQERIIATHDASTNPPRIDFRADFTESEIVGGVVSYEIVPAHFGAVTEAIAQGAAMNLLVGARRVTKAQHSMLMVNFKSAMKTAMDHFTFKQNRSPKKYERDTVDNRNRSGGLYGIR